MAQRPNNKLQYCLSDTLRRLLRPAPTPQEPRQTGQPLLLEGARSTRRGFRVGLVVSWGGFLSTVTEVDRQSVLPALNHYLKIP